MSRNPRLTVLAALLCLPGLSFLADGTAESAGDTLRPASSFASIADDGERSAALFAEAGRVLLHPRCVNCHPAGDHPLQGAGDRLHEPPVQRGIGGMGAVGMRCSACHQDANFDPGAVPGAPHWRLAPRQMAWEGLSLAELCAQIKDPARNGRRTVEEIVEHLTGDELVLWGWAPGAGREAVPGPPATFAGLVRAWAESGAACPP